MIWTRCNETDILVKAVFITQLDANEIRQCEYIWLSNTQVLLSRTTDDYDIAFLRLNIITGQRTYLSELTKMKLLSKGCSFFKVSLDGRWVLCMNSQETVFTTKLNGTHSMQWRHDWSNIEQLDNVEWLNDKHHWIGFFKERHGRNYTHAIIYDINDIQYKKIVRISSTCPINYGYTSVDSSIIVSDNEILSSAVCWNNIQTTQVKVNTWKLMENSFPVHELTLNLPRNATLQSLRFSPQGDMILYALQFKETPLLFSLLHQLWPNINLRSTIHNSLWLSETRSGKMHMLGVIKQRLDPSLIQWLPDGKHLSFIYKDRLYMFPID